MIRIAGNNPREQSAAFRGAHRSAFSLVELLIVIGIIVLILALAVPAFNFISGTRSVDQAQNQINVLLGIARNQAIGTQANVGVMFYVDPLSKNIDAALVVESPRVDTDLPEVVYLNLSDEGDAITLPKGVGAQTVDDVFMAGPPPGTRQDDAYLGYNTTNANGPTGTLVKYGGVILFDGRGQLTAKQYAFRVIDTGSGAVTRMGNLLFDPSDPLASTVTPVDVVPILSGSKVLHSQVGMVLFDLDAFRGIDANTEDDLQVSQPAMPYMGSDEEREEKWIDQNSLPLLVNRYNGTLIRGD